MKVCSKCKEEKESSLFSKNKARYDGLFMWCKKCASDNQKIYAKLNKEKIAQYSKEYNSKNKERRKEYKIKNKEKIKSQSKIYYQQNKDKYNQYTDRKKEYNKRYYSLNKDKIKITEKNRYIKNKTKIIQQKNEYVKNRKQKDHIFKFRVCVRDSISKSFKRGKCLFKKNAKTETILGCTIEEFRLYIESKFTEGMSFENHGKNGWHLDHIIPVSIAQTEEEVIKLNHYTNFQPLWAEDNLRKSNKI